MRVLLYCLFWSLLSIAHTPRVYAVSVDHVLPLYVTCHRTKADLGFPCIKGDGLFEKLADGWAK